MKAPQKDYNQMKEFLSNAFKNVDLSVDKEQLAAMMLKATELPSNQSIEAIQHIVGQRTDENEKSKAIHDYLQDFVQRQ